MDNPALTRWATILVAAVVVLLIILVAVSTGALRSSAGKFSSYTLDRTQHVPSAIDGLRYRVHVSHGNFTRAADLMAVLNARVIDLLRHLRRKYPESATGPRAVATRRLLNRYNPDNLAENSPRDPEGDTSYTIDKGAILALCLRRKEFSDDGDTSNDYNLHDLETLTFVTLHELAHIAIEDLDHPPAFWSAFKFILLEGREAGVVDGVDYRKTPTIYCGMAVDYNPLYDPSLRPLG